MPKNNIKCFGKLYCQLIECRTCIHKYNCEMKYQRTTKKIIQMFGGIRL